MCAIFSSPNFEKFKNLYNVNLGRGNFAYGFAFLNKENLEFEIFKGPGICDFKDFDETKYKYFIGHTQAPTSSIRTFNKETSHPFVINKICVSHNGVLSNDTQLKKKTKSRYNEVDSSVIPALINDKYPKWFPEVSREETICSVLSELEGTYSVWVIIESNLYFGRAGSTLFYNDETREISSIKTPDIQKEVPEGYLFKISKFGIKAVGNFTVNSPFLVL